jgi:hypothetical protein
VSIEKAVFDDLAVQCRPFVDDGEEIEGVFTGTGGSAAGTALSASPASWIAGSPLGWLLGGRFYVVAITDRSIILFRQNYLTKNVSKVVARLPRHTRLDPTGPNGAPGAGWVTVDGKALLVPSEEGMTVARAADAGLDTPPHWRITRCGRADVGKRPAENDVP